jgi:hypothetical protein
MKTIKISILALTLGLMSFNSISNAVIESTTAVGKSLISWKSATIDVHEIPQGTPKVIDFEFENTGKAAIIITNVQGSCGCTATSYTKTPILPGETAKVQATYNAANKGAFAKTVTVTTNSGEAPTVLTLKGIVI